VTPANARIADDLTWFWNWAEGELGVPSNYMAMVNAIRLGTRRSGGSPSTEMDPGRLAAATRMRLIERTLQRLTSDDRRVLFAAFGPHARNLPLLDELAPVAVLTKAARAAHVASNTNRTIGEWLLRLVHRVSNGLGDHVAEDRVTVHAIATEARALLDQSLRAYSEAWRLRPGAPGKVDVPSAATQARSRPLVPARPENAAVGRGTARHATARDRSK
jgi:hypothetical protein